MRKLVRSVIQVVLVLSASGSVAHATQFRQVTTCCPVGRTVWRLSQPVLSPDAAAIAYCDETQYSQAEAAPSFIEFLALGARALPDFILLPASWGRMTAPAWSPDGQHLAFVCESPDPAHAGIWIAGRAHAGLPAVRRVAASDAHDPAWSPDGASIAYVSQDLLWITSNLGTAPERVPVPGPVASPSWATGGIAYSHAGHVWLYHDGRNKQLTFGHATDSTPALSSDGEWIVFASDRAGNPDLWVVSAGGGTPVRITDDAAEEIDPAWSAAGDEVAFVSWRGGSPNVWIAAELPRFTTGVGHATWSGVKASYGQPER